MKINKATWITAICVVLIAAVLITINTMNNRIPTLSKEDVAELILVDQADKIEEIKQYLNVSEMTVELDLPDSSYDYEYEKPTIFNDGRIIIGAYTLYYTSDEFTELEIFEHIHRKRKSQVTEAESTEAERVFSKYNGTGYPRIYEDQIDRYEICTYGITGSSDVKVFFVDSQGNKYEFDHKHGYDNVYKNGDCIYSVGDNDNYSTDTTCALCNGTGVAKFYYGGSAMEAWLDGYNDYEYKKCPSCNGTGNKN